MNKEHCKLGKDLKKYETSMWNFFCGYIGGAQGTTPVIS